MAHNGRACVPDQHFSKKRGPIWYSMRNTRRSSPHVYTRHPIYIPCIRESVPRSRRVYAPYTYTSTYIVVLRQLGSGMQIAVSVLLPVVTIRRGRSSRAGGSARREGEGLKGPIVTPGRCTSRDHPRRTQTN